MTRQKFPIKPVQPQRLASIFGIGWTVDDSTTMRVFGQLSNLSHLDNGGRKIIMCAYEEFTEKVGQVRQVGQKQYLCGFECVQPQKTG